MFSVSVVIPAWNGLPFLLANLPDVLSAKENKNNSILEIIVVDDGSTDATSQELKRQFNGKVRIIKHTKNRGFSAAVNTGVRMAKGSLVCLLNQDVSVTADFLVKVIPLFEKRNIFGVSFHEGGFGPAVGKFSDGFVGHQGGVERDKTGETFWVNGGSGAFKRDIWMKLGGLDETLFSPFYWEDVDICYRAMKRGYRLLWEPEARVVHNHESTINPKNFSERRLNLIKERNQVIFVWKNITSANLFRKHLVGLLGRTFRHPGYLRVVISALSKLPSILKARRIEKKEAKISDEAIFARFKNL